MITWRFALWNNYSHVPVVPGYSFFTYLNASILKSKAMVLAQHGICCFWFVPPKTHLPLPLNILTPEIVYHLGVYLHSVCAERGVTFSKPPNHSKLGIWGTKAVAEHQQRNILVLIQMSHRHKGANKGPVYGL